METLFYDSMASFGFKETTGASTYCIDAEAIIFLFSFQ